MHGVHDLLPLFLSLCIDLEFPSALLPLILTATCEVNYMSFLCHFTYDRTEFKIQELAQGQ